ncbi:ArgS-related anticodon-binding protein NrtL [Streptomyces lushanensis]|uniref:ArgS-related anticodon-binding protein NrtL n=1 Tax=Streptomyces lushanensis TaxID=1434255 RepID=UPI0008378DFF|nr:DALR anticodon-binding domain-containing protein [Streptomyces lushanensis]
MTPAELSRTVRRAVCRAVEDDVLPGPVPERVTVERSRPGGRGDYASNVALRLAGPAGRPPREIAEILRSRVDTTRGIARVEITGPGFLNFTLGRDGRAGLVRTILGDPARYGHGDALAGTAVAFAPPPGGDPRARLWTDTVVRLLRGQGAEAAVVPGAAERLTVVPAGIGPDGLLARLGHDAAHWALLRPAAHDRPYTGPDLLVQRESNALFRVRYAHARARALVRNAAHLGIPSRYTGPDPYPGTRPGPSHDPYGAGLPGRDGTARAAAALLTALGDHPAVLEAAARLRAPDRLARHLEHTAEAFLRFQEICRPLPLGDEKPSAAHSSGTALAEAAGAVLAGGLSLLGIDAPEHL